MVSVCLSVHFFSEAEVRMNKRFISMRLQFMTFRLVDQC